MADVAAAKKKSTEIPGDAFEAGEGEKMKQRARLNMMASNAREPWTISTVMRPIP